jgi:hypothetical protein
MHHWIGLQKVRRGFRQLRAGHLQAVLRQLAPRAAVH